MDPNNPQTGQVLFVDFLGGLLFWLEKVLRSSFWRVGK